MPLEMIHTDERHAEGERECLRRRHTDEERPNKPGTIRDGDLIDVRKPDVRFLKRLLDDGQDAQDVVARSDLGHNAAILLMNRNLRRDHARAQVTRPAQHRR